MKKSLMALAVAFTIACLSSICLGQGDVDKKVADLISKMTLEEKIGQLVQYSGTMLTGPAGEQIDVTTYIKAGKVGSLLNITGADEVAKYQKVAVEQSRLGIPLLFGLDVIHGYKTIFPVPLAMASSWDLEAITKAQRAAAMEASASGICWTFTPMLDIARDPRWGRIVEGFGEDPYLTSVMGVACVKAFQGSGYSEKDSVMATAKHYVGYGAVQAGRDYFTVDISERTLNEVYLPPFKATVDAGVASVMPAFTPINGIPMSANKQLLTDVLRKQWGFSGITVSDWNAINEMINWGVAGSQLQAAEMSINAGMDIDMMASAYSNQLPDLIKAKKVSEETLNKAVANILTKKFQLGLFETPYKYCDSEREAKIVLSQPIKDDARDVAKRSIVLLKNANSLLPLKKDLKTIAVVGPLSTSTVEPIGPWSGLGDGSATVSVFQGIKNALPEGTELLYQPGCDINTSDETMIEPACKIAKNADVIIAVLGESSAMSGEAAVRSEIGLPGVQQKLLKALYETGKPVVLVLFNGRPLTLVWEDRNIPAILEVWYPGSEAGNAIADVMFGKYNPSGKLPVTFPKSVGQIPIFYSYLNTGRPAGIENFTQQSVSKYMNPINTMNAVALGGPTSKYVSRYLDIDNAPLYPFGYGLSYTKFSYSPVELSAKEIPANGSVTASVNVTNAGSIDGEEVVQLYINKPVSPIARPVKQLKAFKKVLIKSGETVNVTFTLGSKDLALLDKDMNWTVESGDYNLYIGTNSIEYQSGSLTVKN